MTDYPGLPTTLLTNLGAVQTFEFKLLRLNRARQWVPFSLGAGGTATFVVIDPEAEPVDEEILAETMTVAQDDSEATIVSYQLDVTDAGLQQRTYRARIRAVASDGEQLSLPLGNEWFQLVVGHA